MWPKMLFNMVPKFVWQAEPINVCEKYLNEHPISNRQMIQNNAIVERFSAEMLSVLNQPLYQRQQRPIIAAYVNRMSFDVVSKSASWSDPVAQLQIETNKPARPTKTDSV